MLVRSGITLAVVASGIALGAVLGAAANPVMKRAPEQPWQGALQAPVTVDSGYHLMVEAPPQDLSPYHDSYAPTWAREELAVAEPEYPAWTYSEFADEPYAPLANEPRIDAQRVIATEAALSSEPSLEPVAPAGVASEQQPAGSAPDDPRLAHLDDIY
jgi:hypothetical protein